MRPLIVRGLDAAVAAAGRRERYGRGQTSHTVLTWWARRPHAAMRAAVFAALAPDTPEHARLLARSLAADPEIEGAMRAAIAGRTLLDPFAGGGTIPLEASRLGVDVTAVDNNELAVFINRCWLEWMPDADPEALAERTRALGDEALAMIERLTAPLFPIRARTHDGRAATTYLFTYRIECACGYRFHLSRRRWLSTKHRIALVPIAGDGGESLVFGAEAVGPHAECPRCAAPATTRVDEAEDVLVAVVHASRGRGKRFMPPSSDALPIAAIETRELALRTALGIEAPRAELYAWSGIVNPPLHGLSTHEALFTPRQRAVLFATIGAIREVTRALAFDERRFFRGVLSGLVDQCVDWNSRLSMWIPQNEQVGRALSGPGVPMLWDFAETDPVARGPANLHDKLERIAAGIASLPARGRGRAVHASAQALPFEDARFDAVVTDPPYYDNVYYSALADFVFVWKRLLVADEAADLFAPERTRASGELVASRQRFGDAAHAIYVRELGRATNEMMRVLKPDGTIAIVYAHASFDGWCAFVEALRAAPLEITQVVPLEIERAARPRAMRSAAVNTCFLFVGRRRTRAPARVEVHGDDAHSAFAQRLIAAVNAPRGTVAEAIEAAEAAVRARWPEFRLERRRSL